uniref:HMG box domain containing 3 n=1 Tax=Cyprinodon variegatus TaxID=28743 RepID=A0A3Q2CTF3_CYPVA
AMEDVEVMEVVKVTEEVESENKRMEMTSPRKRRSKAEENGLEKPKKPRSAYMLYYFDVQQIMQLGTLNLPQSEVNKRISESWKRLSVAEKSYYLERAKLEKEGIDTVRSCKHLPGFRKILPRANCFLLPNSAASNYQSAGSRSEGTIKLQDPPAEEGLSSVALRVPECQVEPVGLAAEVQISELPSVPSDTAEETVESSSVSLQRTSLKPSLKTLTSTDTQDSQGSADETLQAVTVKTKSKPSGAPTFSRPQYSAAGHDDICRSQIGSGYQTFLQNGNNLHHSLKTYTRRGRGRCLNPGCSFMYVTRHKPPTCPECGSHLGGKWTPAVKVQLLLPENTSFKVHSWTQIKGSSKNPSEKAVKSSGVVQKRPVRPILPALYKPGNPGQRSDPPSHAVFLSLAAAPRESLSGLKPSTLKQLGQTVPTNSTNQVKIHKTLTAQNKRDKRCECCVPDVCLRDLFSSRGRGRCKNPACDYIYKNRHKPAVCPKCGSELTRKNTTSPKVGQALQVVQVAYRLGTPAQKDIQRQSTLQLIRSMLQIPESETELQEITRIIQELNSVKVVLVRSGEENNVDTETLFETGWPQFYESAATHCGLCNYPLFKGGQGTVAGQEDCWLLTETLMQTASLQLKVCPNVKCLALHCFTDLHPGLFNIGNRLLVSLDLFLKVRANIKLGQTPSQSFSVFGLPLVHSLSSEGSSQVQELFLCGYWAFECLTVRDYNDMICGICGIAPKVEIAQRDRKYALELKNVEFTWPEGSVSDEVLVDDFWLTMEGEAIEQAAFPADIPITQMDASIIAPFAPPLMRSPTVINTEKDKLMAQIQQPLTYFFLFLSSPPAHLTAGKLSKVCPHKVVCSSKYLVRGETARDHVDLLLSSRNWPPVYVCDCPRQVALCTDLQYPQIAAQMWGRNQGCFSDPFEKPEVNQDTETKENANKQPVVFNNAAYYYLYNRLVDFLSSREVVNQQISQVVKACQPGQVVIRDALYRLGVAEINTEKDGDELETETGENHPIVQGD